MTLELPKAVAAYFGADRVGGEAVAGCFVEEGVVRDEGHTYRGRQAIEKWKTEASARYQYTNEPLRCEEVEGKTVVINRVSGNFPGSPVELRFIFGVEGERIGTLEVVQ